MTPADLAINCLQEIALAIQRCITLVQEYRAESQVTLTRALPLQLRDLPPDYACAHCSRSAVYHGRCRYHLTATLRREYEDTLP